MAFGDILLAGGSQGGVKFNGIKVVGARVIDAGFATPADGTYSANEQALLNSIVAALIAHGLIAAA